MTRAEIQRKINELSRIRNSYNNEKNSYSKSLDYARKLISNLNSSLNYLGAADDDLRKSFFINGKTADGGKVSNVKTEILGIIKKLNGTIIPSMNSNVSSLNNKIRNLDNQIYSLRKQYENAEM